MALPFPIAPDQTDVKSPIDQNLMDSIRLNQVYLDGAIGGITAGGTFNFRVNGQLRHIKKLIEKGYGKRLDGGLALNVTSLNRAVLLLEKGGNDGAVEVDVLKNRTVEQPITSIISAYKGLTQSIGRVGTSLSTQSVSVATPTINTQLITKPKGSLTVRSISILSNGNILYTFTGTTPLDSDYVIGDSVKFSGNNLAVNDGEFLIKGINYDGLPSIAIENAVGEEEAVGAGTAELGLYSYVFNAVVDDDFTEGEEVHFSGHTDIKSDGARTIYKTNQGGNNIWTKYADGVEQSGVAGQAGCSRWVYSFTSAVDATEYAVGEKLEAAGHTDPLNDGKFIIRKVNESGNNLYVTNTQGVVQAGAAGTVDTLRFLYAMPTDPSTGVAAGDEVTMVEHTDELNDGTFIVTFVNRFSGNNIEIYNENGVAQGAAEGGVHTSLKIVSFGQDYSNEYTVDKTRALLEGGASDPILLVNEFLVKDVNRGGLGNYNIVIYAPLLTEQEGVGGRVSSLAKSIFATRPRIEVQNNLVRNFQTDDSATFETEPIEAGEILTMDIIEVQEGNPSTLVLTLS